MLLINPIRSVRRLSVFAVLSGVLSTSSCDSVVDAGEKRPAAPISNLQRSAARPEPPRFAPRTPQYPAAVVYILYREYLHKNPGLTTLGPENKDYQRYVERRLRQLYPGRGYAGMVNDAVEESRQYRLAWAAYRKELLQWRSTIGIMACTGTSLVDPDSGESCLPPSDDGSASPSDPTVDPSWDGEEEYLPPGDESIPTLQMEIDSLQMTQPEADQLYYQESLADGSFYQKWDEVITTQTGKRATIDDLIIAAGEGWTPLDRSRGGRSGATIQVDPGTVTKVLVGAYICFKAWRVYQGAQRAREKSTQYFGHLLEGNTQRDAYRHIFWNMQNRRYVGEDYAQMIGDAYEAYGDNPANARTMDLHNNAIGREVRYRNFRGHLVWDRWDWREWAEKVRNYVTRPENAEYVAEWSTPPTLAEARAREQLVPRWKYIYFAQ